MSNPGQYTISKILGATWIPYPAPRELGEELFEPCPARDDKLLSIYHCDEGWFVVARDGQGQITDSWKVLL